MTSSKTFEQQNAALVKELKDLKQRLNRVQTTLNLISAYTIIIHDKAISDFEGISHETRAVIENDPLVKSRSRFDVLQRKNKECIIAPDLVNLNIARQYSDKHINPAMQWLNRILFKALGFRFQGGYPLELAKLCSALLDYYYFERQNNRKV